MSGGKEPSESMDENPTGERKEPEEGDSSSSSSSLYMFQRTKPSTSFSDKIGQANVHADIDPDGGELTNCAGASSA